jgi:hypothetical protein
MTLHIILYVFKNIFQINPNVNIITITFKHQIKTNGISKISNNYYYYLKKEVLDVFIGRSDG